MVKSKDEIMSALKTRYADDNSDEAIAFIEDVSDTLDDYEKKTSSADDWETKYNELDASWRQKYKDRFFEKSEDLKDDIDKEFDDDKGIVEESEKKTYDDLFEVKE